ncbi:LLM class flavin-dependent oxidoreductase [Amycolatopsis sp. cg5]|uniref:LLM class flavin-dependent oxidoreductase n=1 Tax=Amycolatopsis sp. cg5 TaxID=3238802 RepID=UPI0035256003
MEIGIALPVREIAIKGATDAAPLLKMARQVEDFGFDSLWTGDSFVARHRLEPLTLLAALASVTEHVTVGTAALTAVLRDPILLAHTIVTLDQCSGGRLKLAIGTGNPLPVKAEYDAVTMRYDERAARVDEMIKFFKRAWRGEDGDYTGEYHDYQALRDQSPPLQKGGPPIWLGSNGKPKAVARAGKLYDGWMPVLSTPAKYAESLKAIRDTACITNRDPDEISTSVYVTVNLSNSKQDAMAGLEDFTRRYNNLPLAPMSAYQLYFGGSASAFTRWISDYADAGARHIVIRVGSFDHYDRQVRTLADEVVPAVKGA